MDFLTDFESEYAEVDPTGRYGRYNEVLGKGASKIVYRAFDEYEGIEVAWNQVKLNDFLQSPGDLERLYCEIHLLKTLNHGNIMKFFASWVDTTKNNINFITELFNSGTLRQYRLKHKRVSTRAVKHWCRQILKGLLYLHSQDPPVIHRDLKCDNIFINGNHGEVKIGDLGLAAILFQSHAAHCVGTPEFMAPEVYGEEYNELVDIYSFGMCILELVTFEIPYSECTNPVQIYKKVISGKKPDALYKVKDPELRQFIEKCLVTVSSRLSARELLFDPYLRTDDYSCDLRSIDFNSDCSYPNQYCNSNSNDCDPYNDEWKKYPVEIEANGIELFEFDHHDGEEHSPDASVTIKGKRREDGSIFLRLKIADKEGEIRNIYFPFDVEMDTSLTVAMEMVGELDITDHDVTYIAQMIDGEISKLVPEWKLEMDFEELSLNCSLSHTSFSSCIEFFSVTPGHNSSDSCGAIHGRFEEIVYKADGSEPDVQLTENWDCPESVEFSSLDSATSRHSENDQLDKPISYKKEKYGGWKEVLENFCSDLSFPSMQQAISASVEWEMRWLKAKHQLEAREVMNA